MATTTTKLALTKPDGTDLVDIAVLNTNADKIDAASGATICTSTTRPASPWNGQIIFETDTLGGFVWRSSTSSWTSLGGSTVSSDPPATAANGDLWWDSDNGKLYIYYVDANSSQWVSVMPATTQVEVAQNYIINGGMDIWQRGTSIAGSAASAYTVDRFRCYSAAASTVTRITAGIPAGFTYAAEVKATASNANMVFGTQIEYTQFVNLLGKIYTFSFYAKALNTNAASKNVSVIFRTSTSQDAAIFYNVAAIQTTSVNISSTEWTRYTVTSSAVLASDVKSFSVEILGSSLAANDGYAITGVQLEAGSVATTFRRNAPSIQAELAACQRYYQVVASGGELIGNGQAYGTAQAYVMVQFNTPMRAAPTLPPTLSATTHFQVASSAGAVLILNSITFPSASERRARFNIQVAAGLTAGQALILESNNAAAFIGFSAEL